MAHDKRQVSFISGHTNLSQANFDREYIPLIDDAITNGNDFILGDAVGVDAMALAYLLGPKHGVARRITLYPSRKYNIPRLEALAVKVIGPDDPRLQPTPAIETLIGIRNEGRDKGRYRHLIRDTHMTLNSDSDILFVRNEEESRKVYGDKYKARISATKYNRQMREKLQSMKLTA